MLLLVVHELQQEPGRPMILKWYILFCCYISFWFCTKKKHSVVWDSSLIRLRGIEIWTADFWHCWTFDLRSHCVISFFVNRGFLLVIRLVSNLANGMVEKSESMTNCCDADFSCESCTGITDHMFALEYLDYTRELLMYLHTQLHNHNCNVCFLLFTIAIYHAWRDEIVFFCSL